MAGGCYNLQHSKAWGFAGGCKQRAKFRFLAPVDIPVIACQAEQTKTSRWPSAADDERRLGFRGKMAACQAASAPFFHLPLPPPPPTPSPPPPLSGPPLLCTSVGMYPPLNRSGRAAPGSLTAQRGSSINQRHFQCPITETALLGLSGADSSPIHLLGQGGGERRKVVETAGGGDRERESEREGEKKPLWRAARPLPVQTEGLLRAPAGRPLRNCFLWVRKTTKKGKLLVSGNTRQRREVGGGRWVRLKGASGWGRGRAGGRSVAE